MSYPNRELSQFAYFLKVNDTNQKIAITTTATPFVGIGSTDPKEKLDVLGNIKSSGIVSAVAFYGDGSNLDNVAAVIDGYFVSTPSGIWTGSNVGIGTSTFTQKLNVGGSVIASRFISNVPQGTAPFQVSSNTLVSNLNATLLNGKAAPNGNIVGTTDSQTLTNKTLTSPIIAVIRNNNVSINVPTTAGTIIHTGSSGIITSALYGDESITNVHIAANAGISYTKLNLSNSIVNADISSGAGITYSKLVLSNSVRSSDIDPNNRIQNNKLLNNTISGVSLGSSLNNLIAGNFLNGDEYNGSQEVYFDVNATTENSAGAIVARDSDGDIRANNIISEGGLFSSSSTSFLNRIINGDMIIAQRAPANNQSLALTISNSSAYWIDRWAAFAFNSGGTAGQAQVQSIVDAPSTLRRSLNYINNVAVPTTVAGGLFCVVQPIEGVNVYDLAYGTSESKTVTLSFWVKSSVTGTFSGSCRSMSGTAPSQTYKSYVFQYSIDVANNWEYKTVVVPGDTVDDINVDLREGYSVNFDLGSGSNYQTSTVNTWLNGNFIRSSGSVRLCATPNATWQVTGVQLKVGNFENLEMPFERVSYSEQLLACQRYYERPVFISGGGVSSSGVNLYGMCYFNNIKRVVPTVSVSDVFLSGAATNILVDSTFSNCLRFVITNGAGTATLAQANLSLDAEL